MKEKSSIPHINKSEAIHACMVGFLMGSGTYYLNSQHPLLTASSVIGLIYGVYNMKVSIEHIIKRLEENNLS